MNTSSKNPSEKKDTTPPDPIQNKEEIQKNNDEHIDQDFPGYPHYPAKEDIMNPKNHTERVTADVENLTRDSLKKQPAELKSAPADPTKIEDEEDLGIVSGTEADVTKDDLLALGSKDRDMDLGEDEEIQSDGSGSAFSGTETVTDLVEEDLTDNLKRTGEDLDVPGEELDNANEEIGEEDEENNYYSLGGDEKDNLEDDANAQDY